MHVHLPARAPFDAQGLLDWHALHALGGLEQVERDDTGRVTSYGRLVDLPGGPLASRRRPRPRGRPAPQRVGPASTCGCDSPPCPTCRRSSRGVRSLFDLDADPEAVDAVLAAVPELAPAVARVPGIRLPGHADADEVLFRTLIGQQVSVAAARTAQTRLVAALGAPVPDVLVPGGRLFPTAAVIAERGREVLRGPAARVDTIIRVAEALAVGTLVVDPGQSLDELRADSSR